MTREEVAQLQAAATAVLLGLTLAALGATGHASITYGLALVAAAALTLRRT